MSITLESTKWDFHTFYRQLAQLEERFRDIFNDIASLIGQIQSEVMMKTNDSQRHGPSTMPTKLERCLKRINNFLHVPYENVDEIVLKYFNYNG